MTPKIWHGAARVANRILWLAGLAAAVGCGKTEGVETLRVQQESDGIGFCLCAETDS